MSESSTTQPADQAVEPSLISTDTSSSPHDRDPHPDEKRTSLDTVDLTLTVSREHADWLEKAASTFGVPASALVSLAITFLERNFKI